MSRRYLLIVADECAGTNLLSGLASRTGLELAFSNSRIGALVDRACPCIAIGEAGCILGSLFYRHGPARPVQALSAPDAAQVIDGRGQALLSSYWGGYVAAIASEDCVEILRDPSATFPCYYAAGPGFTAFASDAEILAKTGLIRAEIDFEALAQHFYRAGVPAPETALRGIQELLGGFAIRVRGAANSQQLCWSPWDHLLERDEGGEGAPARLARTVVHCVAAWASTHGRLLLSVSGGLDSSIVAASLARAKAETVCLTMFADDPGGDERIFARALCERLGFTLVERSYRLDDIDITEPLGSHLPRPTDRTQAIAYERVHLEVAAEIGAAAFITGNGGDSVFGYSQSAAPIADRFMRQGMALGVVGTLHDVCRQTGCSIFDALAGAWRLTRGPAAYRCRPNPLFLHPEILAGLAGTKCNHPWLDAPADALPGKAAHIAWMLRVQQCLEPSRAALMPVLNPLMSQPIVETCLEIPSWEWRAGGRDRAIAREAFARDLPPIIVNRRLKGGPSHFAARILDRFRGTIRERLLGGYLARHGIVDTDALEEVLRRDRPCPDEQRVRILEFVAAEAWLDHWSARSNRPEPAQTYIRAASLGRPQL